MVLALDEDYMKKMRIARNMKRKFGNSFTASP